MINTKELRRLAQAATPGPDGVSLNWLKLLQDFQEKANPAVISEIIDRLEDAGKDIARKERIIDSLGAKLNDVASERDALRARIERMEKQEPVWFIDERGEPKKYHKSKADYCKYGGLDLLYALPGAKGE